MSSWTTPKTWAYKETLSSADMNTYVKDNIQYLKDNLIASVIANTPAGRIAATTVQAAIDEIDDEKPHVIKRQGGNSTNWSTAGTTDYDVADAVIEVGVVSAPLATAVTVTFPTAFTQVPVVILSTMATGNPYFPLTLTSVTTTQFVFNNYLSSPTQTCYCFWIAIGK